jgi:hypothetical protein
MDFLFTQKKTYSFNEPMKNIVDDVQDIINKRNRLYGKFNTDNNSFEIARVWAIMANRGSPARLKGTITQESGKTIIQTTLRPNTAYIFCFYFLAILFFCGLFGIVPRDSSRIETASTFLFLDAYFFAFMFIGTYRLKKTFEKELLRRRVRQDIAVGGFHLNADNDKNIQ